MNTSVGATEPHDRSERMTVLALAGVALLTATIGIGVKSFWFDEGYSAELARQPAGDWWRLLWEQEGGAVLHAVVLKPWSMVSDADAWLRLLSVPFAVGQVVLTYFVGRRVIGRTAWAAALALAVNGAFVHYAQEARAYAMASFFVVTAALAFVRAVERPTAPRLAGFAALASLCPFAHLSTAPFVVAMGLTLLLFASRSQPWSRWVVAGGVVVVAWTALAAAVLSAGSGGAQARDELADRVTSLTYVPRQFLSPYWLPGWIVLLLAAVWIVRLVPLLRRDPRSDRSLVAALPAMLVAVPLIVALVLPQIDLDTNRYLLPVLPFLLIMAVGGVGRLSEVRVEASGPVWAVGIGVILLVSISGLVRWHIVEEKMDAREWTARLADGVEAGDRVVFDDAYGRIVTEHYLGQGDLDLSGADPIRPAEPFGAYVWDPEREAIGACLLDEVDVGRVVSDGDRTWIVLAVPESCWSTERVIETIDRTGRTVTQRTDLDGPAALLLVE